MSTEIQKPDEREGWTSASNAPADALCAGRHNAQKGLPDIATEDSKFGEQIHNALSSGDSSKLEPDQLSIFDGCQEISEKLIADKFGPFAAQTTSIKEERYWWSADTGKIKHSCRIDLLVYHKDDALLIEFKTLPGDVEGAATNEQLRDQVAMIAGKHRFATVDVAVVQPLVTYSPQICRYDAASILRSQVEMAIRVRASNDPNAKRVAGVVQCKNCKARYICKEYSAFTALAAPVAMSSLTVPVHMWTVEQRALFCERLPIATKWLEECKKQIKEMIAKDPNAIPGWRLAEGSLKRPVTNPNELHTRFLSAGGTSEQFLACVEIGKGKLEAEIRKVTQLKGKKLAARIDEMLAGITDEKRDAPSLELIR